MTSTFFLSIDRVYRLIFSSCDLQQHLILFAVKYAGRCFKTLIHYICRIENIIVPVIENKGLSCFSFSIFLKVQIKLASTPKLLTVL